MPPDPKELMRHFAAVWREGSDSLPRELPAPRRDSSGKMVIEYADVMALRNEITDEWTVIASDVHVAAPPWLLTIELSALLATQPEAPPTLSADEERAIIDALLGEHAASGLLPQDHWYRGLADALARGAIPGRHHDLRTASALQTIQNRFTAELAQRGMVARASLPRLLAETALTPVGNVVASIHTRKPTGREMDILLQLATTELHLIRQPEYEGW